MTSSNASVQISTASDSRRETLSPSDDKRSGGVTRRVVFLCLALACVFGYVIPIIDVKLQNSYLGATHLPAGGIAVLLILLLLINPILRVLAPRLRFSRNEMLVVYTTCLFSCLVPGHGSETVVIGVMIAPFYYATAENGHLEFLQPYLKSWFSPAMGNGSYDAAGRKVVEDWFVGLRPEEAIPWGAWMLPLLAWSALFIALYAMMACLAVMLRAQWSDREALAFPLLRLPIEMTEDADDPSRAVGAFFRNATMWLGFAIAASIQMVNGLRLYYPEVPLVPLALNLNAYFTEPPWNQIDWVPLHIFPIVIGLAFLLTLEVSFSLWFFFWFFKFQLMIAYVLGFPSATIETTPTSLSKTFTGHQQVGAFLVFAAVLLWTGREHFKHIAKRAFGRAASTREEKSEALSYPVAFWGFVLSFAFIVAWSVAAGIRMDIAIAMWVLYLVIIISLSRVVAEGGLLFVVHSWIPLGILGQLINSGPGAWLIPSSIVPAAFIQPVTMNLCRGLLMPSFVQGFKLAHDRGIRTRPLLALISACVLITLFLGLWMRVKLGYENGGLTLHQWFARSEPNEAIRISTDLIDGARGVSWTNWLWLGFGGAFTYFMMAARSFLPWFPLHPIGYLMGLTYPAHLLWFSILLGWLFKALVMRFGGIDSYRKVLPMFLGLILGDVAMTLFWLVVDALQNPPRIGHQLIPG